MIRKLIAIAFLLPQISEARVTVTSGEHEEFTRLFFDSQTTSAYSISEKSNQIVVKFASPLPEIDVGTVFSRIPRTRVADVETTQDTVTIDLNCACTYVVSEFGATSFYIDVSYAQNQVDPGKQNLNIEAVLPLFLAEETSLIDPIYSTLASNLLNSRSTERNVSSEDKERENGLINSSTEQSRLGEASNTQTIGPQSFSKNKLNNLRTPLLGDSDTTRRFRENTDLTVIDTRQFGLLPTRPEETSCNKSSPAAPRQWLKEQPIHEVGKWRSQVFSSTGTSNDLAIYELAAVYTANGFFSEALHVLSFMVFSNENVDELRNFLSIATGIKPFDADFFQSRLRCSTYFALFAILDEGEAFDPNEEQTDAIIRAFSQLPSSLQRAIFPKLHLGLTTAERSDVASALNRVLVRATRTDYDLTVLNVLTADELTYEQIDRDVLFAQAISQNSTVSPLALIKRTEENLAKLRPISDEDMILMESYLVELEGEPIFNLLGKTLVRSHIAREEFGEARRNLRFHAGVGALDWTLVENEYWTKLLETQSKTSFLEGVTQYEFLRDFSPNAYQTLRLSQRSWQMGFERVAYDVAFANDQKETMLDVSMQVIESVNSGDQNSWSGAYLEWLASKMKDSRAERLTFVTDSATDEGSATNTDLALSQQQSSPSLAQSRKVLAGLEEVYHDVQTLLSE